MSKITDARLDERIAAARHDAETQLSVRYKREAEEDLSAFTELRALRSKSEAVDPDRALKDALFANLKDGRTSAQYGGVLADEHGGMAWISYHVRPPRTHPAPATVVSDEILAARDFIADVTARADSLGIGMAKYPTAEIKILLAALVAALTEEGA